MAIAPKVKNDTMFDPMPSELAPAPPMEGAPGYSGGAEHLAPPPDTNELPAAPHIATEAPVQEPGMQKLRDTGLQGQALHQEGQARHAAQLQDFADQKSDNLYQHSLLRVTDPDYMNKLMKLNADRGKIKEDEAVYKEMHPWGSMESSHPGVFGKIGHAFGAIGNVAGEALAPGLAEAIPGSHANLEEQKAQGAGEQQAALKGYTEAEAAGLTGQKAVTEAAKPALMAQQGEQAEAKTGLENKQTDLMAQKPEIDAIHDLMTGDNGKPRIDPLTGVPFTYAGAYRVAEQAKHAGTQKDQKLQHVAGVMNGQQAMANFDPVKGEYTNPDTHEPMPGFKPQPNYAQTVPSRLETQTKELTGPDGIAHQYGWDPQTKRYDIDMGVAGTGTQGSRLFASGVSKQAGDTLIHDIQANRDNLGTLATWVQKYGIDTPIGDPVLARLQAELASFAALQPAQHGFRSSSAMEAFEKILGGLQKNPDATIESIRGINAITSQSLPKSGPGPAPTEGGGSEVEYEIKGGKLVPVQKGKQ